MVESIPSVLVGKVWQGLFDGSTRSLIERQGLRPFLQRQRWFSSKSRVIKNAGFTDWATIRSGAVPAFIAVASVSYRDGWNESYFLPLALVSGDQADRVLRENPGSVMVRIAGARRGILIDGLQEDGTCERLLSLVDRSGETPTKRGLLRGARMGGPLQRAAEHKWVRPKGDQSNSILFIDDRYALKLFRRIEPGPNPDFEISRFLSQHGYAHTPALTGALEYHRRGLEPGTLGILQAAVQHQGSGWDYTIEDLKRYYERVATRVRHWGKRLEITARMHSPVMARPDEQPPPFFASLERWYLHTAAVLGKRTAELHLTLSNSSELSFAPEPFTQFETARLADEMRASADEALELLGNRLSSLSESSRAQGQAVLAARDALVGIFEHIRRLDSAAARVRVHGDYHLGQVLRTGEDFVIIDFEGEPARPLAERRAKQSPLKDVAGMLRSFDYAANAALFAFIVHSPDDEALLRPWAETWQHWVSATFLAAYRSRLSAGDPAKATDSVNGSAIVPQENEAFGAMLRAFVLEKAFYELGYELNNRPDWVHIPLAGILRLADDSQN
jgi:maltose alpha-D-glucosyltransferase/alpha-amylase